MTFLEMCQRTRQECGIQGEGPSSTTNQIGLLKKVVNWVSSANNYIQSLHPDWNFLWKEFTEDTVVGVDTIVRPSDYSLWDRESFSINRGTEDGQPLSIVTYGEWRTLNSKKEQQRPSIACVLPNNNIALSAPADDVYSFYATYWKTPDVLTESSDVSSIPTRFEMIIVYKAMESFFKDIESFDQMKTAEMEYINILHSLEQAELPDNLTYGQHSPEQIIMRPV